MNYSYLIQGLVGFFGVLLGTAVSWGYMKARITGLYEWRSEHVDDHKLIDHRLTKYGRQIAVLNDRAGIDN